LVGTCGAGRNGDRRSESIAGHAPTAQRLDDLILVTAERNDIHIGGARVIRNQ